MSIADMIGTWLSGTVTKATDQSTTNLQQKLNDSAIRTMLLGLFVLFIAVLLFKKR